MDVADEVIARAWGARPPRRPFALRSSLTSNLSALIAAALLLPCALLASCGAVALLPEAIGSWGAVAGEAFLVPLALILDLFTCRLLREAFPGRSYLELSPLTLVLRHGVLLRKRLEIPLSQVDVVAIDTPRSPGFWDTSGFALEMAKGAVTWTAGAAQTSEVLDARTRFMLPLASHVQDDVPNVAIVLRSPLDLSDVRRSPVSARRAEVLRLCDVDQLRGFLVPLKDPAEAEALFDARGLLGKLDARHSRLLDVVEKEDVRRLRRLRWKLMLGRVVPVLVAARLVWGLLEGSLW